MFKNKRYLTRGVQAEISPVLQLFMWECIDNLPAEKDYVQVFRLEEIDGIQRITHSSEQPEHHMDYLLPTIRETTINKIYVIDDGEHSTMLLAEEY